MRGQLHSAQDQRQTALLQRKAYVTAKAMQGRVALATRVQVALHTMDLEVRHIVAPGEPAIQAQEGQSTEVPVDRPTRVLAALDTTDQGGRHMRAPGDRHTTVLAVLAIPVQEGLAIQVPAEAGEAARPSASRGVT